MRLATASESPGDPAEAGAVDDSRVHAVQVTRRAAPAVLEDEHGIHVDAPLLANNGPPEIGAMIGSSLHSPIAPEEASPAWRVGA